MEYGVCEEAAGCAAPRLPRKHGRRRRHGPGRRQTDTRHQRELDRHRRQGATRVNAARWRHFPENTNLLAQAHMCDKEYSRSTVIQNLNSELHVITNSEFSSKFWNNRLLSVLLRIMKKKTLRILQMGAMLIDDSFRMIYAGISGTIRAAFARIGHDVTR